MNNVMRIFFALFLMVSGFTVQGQGNNPTPAQRGSENLHRYLLTEIATSVASYDTSVTQIEDFYKSYVQSRENAELNELYTTAAETSIATTSRTLLNDILVYAIRDANTRLTDDNANIWTLIRLNSRASILSTFVADFLYSMKQAFDLHTSIVAYRSEITNLQAELDALMCDTTDADPPPAGCSSIPESIGSLEEERLATELLLAEAVANAQITVVSIDTELGIARTHFDSLSE